MLRKVEVENGIVEGLPAADPRITSFKGIPFAAAPVGENRWRAPQPAKNWDGVLKAYGFAPGALQSKIVIDVNNIYTREWAVDPDTPLSEDCLHLNVWTPANSKDEKLPVFVWYFGGGLQVGNPAEMEFDGERIARRGIVVVTVNYRLNVFGFLCHPDITAENPEAPANFGNLDQQFATQWVKRNIAAFGGDPDNITIGGQSAGGGSVISQLVSPQNKDFCQAAIIESGIFKDLYPNNLSQFGKITLHDAEKEGIKFFEYLGVSSLEEARKLDAEYVENKALEYNKFWGPVVDNKFNEGDSFEGLLARKYNNVPILIGHTSDEFYSTPNVKTIDEFKELAIQMFGDDADEFLTLCKVNEGTIDDVLKRASVKGIEYAIRVYAEGVNKLDHKKPIYYYNFDGEIPGWDNPGTFHSVDLWFFFETLAKCWRPFVGKHYDLARQMCNYWCNFIKNGNPNGKDCTGEEMPNWKSYSVEKPYGMLFADKAEFVEEEPSEVMKFLVKEYFKRK